MKVSTLIKSFAVGLCWISAASFAPLNTASAQYEVGKDYNVVTPPQPTEDASKIEVIEFFWYGCGHCYKIEPLFNDWAKRAPSDVNVKKLHAIGGGFTELGVMYYTLEAMGRLKDMNTKVFDAIHAENIPLQSKSKRNDWLTKQGIDPVKFEEMSKSFSVVTRVNRAAQLTKVYAVESVPRFIVNGRFGTSVPQGRGYEATFPIIDYLIAQSRKNKVASTAAPEVAAPAAPAKATKPTTNATKTATK